MVMLDGEDTVCECDASSPSLKTQVLSEEDRLGEVQLSDGYRWLVDRLGRLGSV